MLLWEKLYLLQFMKYQKAVSDSPESDNLLENQLYVAFAGAADPLLWLTVSP